MLCLVTSSESGRSDFFELEFTPIDAEQHAVAEQNQAMLLQESH